MHPIPGTSPPMMNSPTKPQQWQHPPFAPESSPATNTLMLQLQHQVDFYFSEYNLKRDSYLLSLLAEEPVGAVPVQAICSFPKIRDLYHQYASVTAGGPPNHAPLDVHLLVAAMESSRTVRVSECGNFIIPVATTGIPNSCAAEAAAPSSPVGPDQQDSGANTEQGNGVRKDRTNMTPSPCFSQATSETSQGVPTHPLPMTSKARCTVIVRDVESTCSFEEIAAAFTTPTARPVTVRPEIGNTWFVQFASEADALAGLSAANSRTLRGQPIHSRIKSELAQHTSPSPPVMHQFPPPVFVPQPQHIEHLHRGPIQQGVPMYLHPQQYGMMGAPPPGMPYFPAYGIAAVGPQPHAMPMGNPNYHHVGYGNPHWQQAEGMVMPMQQEQLPQRLLQPEPDESRAVVHTPTSPPVLNVELPPSGDPETNDNVIAASGSIRSGSNSIGSDSLAGNPANRQHWNRKRKENKRFQKTFSRRGSAASTVSNNSTSSVGGAKKDSGDEVDSVYKQQPKQIGLVDNKSQVKKKPKDDNKMDSKVKSGDVPTQTAVQNKKNRNRQNRNDYQNRRSNKKVGYQHQRSNSSLSGKEKEQRQEGQMWKDEHFPALTGDGLRSKAGESRAADASPQRPAYVQALKNPSAARAQQQPNIEQSFKAMSVS